MRHRMHASPYPQALTGSADADREDPGSRLYEFGAAIGRVKSVLNQQRLKSVRV